MATIEISNDFIVNGTRDLPDCSIVPQATSSIKAGHLEINDSYSYKWFIVAPHQ
jgi:hypothetical protein